MGSTLHSALELEFALANELAVERQPGERIFRRAAFLDGFEIDDASVGVGIQLADFLTRPKAAVKQPLERLARQNDVRCYAVIKRETLAIAELAVATRERTAATLGDATWESLDEEVREFVGSPLLAGLAGKLLRRYADTPERLPVLDCLLQLAPGYIQVMAALMEKWFERSPGYDFKLSNSVREPGAAAVGGMLDSCYIWRSGGAVASRSGRG